LLDRLLHWRIYERTINSEEVKEIGMGQYFTWWQLPLLLVVILLIVFWVMYRRRQM